MNTEQMMLAIVESLMAKKATKKEVMKMVYDHFHTLNVPDYVKQNLAFAFYRELSQIAQNKERNLNK